MWTAVGVIIRKNNNNCRNDDDLIPDSDIFFVSLRDCPVILPVLTLPVCCYFALVLDFCSILTK